MTMPLALGKKAILIWPEKVLLVALILIQFG